MKIFNKILALSAILCLTSIGNAFNAPEFKEIARMDNDKLFNKYSSYINQLRAMQNKLKEARKKGNHKQAIDFSIGQNNVMQKIAHINALMALKHIEDSK